MEIGEKGDYQRLVFECHPVHFGTAVHVLRSIVQGILKKHDWDYHVVATHVEEEQGRFAMKSDKDADREVLVDVVRLITGLQRTQLLTKVTPGRR